MLPHDEDLRAAADVLNAGRRVALLVGQGARGAQDEVVAVAERLGAGVTTSLLGKPYVDESLPFAAGVMGHLGTTASAQLLGSCDTLLMVGTNDPWTEFYPAPGQARGVQMDIDGRHLGNRYPIEVGLVGDAARDAAGAAAAAASSAPSSAWRQEVEGTVRDWQRHRRQERATPARRRSIPSWWSVRSARTCPPTRRSAWTSGRSSTGTPASCRLPRRGAGAPVQHAGVDGVRRCPTGSPPSSPTPTGRWWRWPATARCR